MFRAEDRRGRFVCAEWPAVWSAKTLLSPLLTHLCFPDLARFEFRRDELCSRWLVGWIDHLQSRCGHAGKMLLLEHFIVGD